MRKNTNSLLADIPDSKLPEIAKRLVYFRQDIIKASQEQFAASLNVTQSYLSRVETGQKAITEGLIQRICSAYKLNTDWLLSGIGESALEDPSICHEEPPLSKTRRQAFRDLKTSYGLKNADLDFLSWYLQLSPVDRNSFTRSIKELRRILN